ncbi:MAG: hypothetical protein NC318_08540 [Blautia sp.]|nr:hypothetical protein [Lachnoclostridium sp.]MCM1211637.1 hypothetical protein [Blautia sp.]
MQQIETFIRILPSLYRLGQDAVYACLPEGAESPAQEMTALEIYRQGGTFLYLRYPNELHQGLLVSLVESLLNRPAILFVNNEGDYARHWKTQGWYISGDRMMQTGIMTVCGFRALVPWNCRVKAEAEGISFERVCFGKKELEECEDGFFSWDGEFRFLIHEGKRFWQEAQIRYELDGYDSFTRRWLSVLCRTKEPRWETEGYEEENVKLNAPAYIKAAVCWNIQKETLFIVPHNKDISITNFPPIRMKALSFRFAKGTEEYFLAPFGEGVFLTDGDVPVGQKGFFKICQGDRMEMVIEAEGYLGRRGLHAEVSMLKIHAPFYAAGTELEVCTSFPVLPPGGDRVRGEVERFQRRKMQEGCRLAYHRNVSFNMKEFEMCVCGRDILWFNLYKTERKIPGIALCKTSTALSQAIVSDEFFVVLDHWDSGLFSIPYTIDEASLARAGQMGYPLEECSRLARFYPKGQIFLSEDSFRQGIDKAACSYRAQIQDACHHFRINQAGRDFTFAPRTWEAQAIFLVVKKGKSFSVTELALDSKRWSLWREEKESTQQILIQICEEAQKTPWEPVFVRKEWEGGIVIYGKAQSGEQRKFLVLQDKMQCL